MMRRLDYTLSNYSGAEWFDTVIEAMLMALLAFGPFTFGTVHAWSQETAIVLAAGISLAFLLKMALCRTVRFVWSWAYLPVALLILVVAIQLLPLPTSLVGVISPRTVALRTELSGGVPSGSSTPLSFYPCATAHDLRILLILASVFVVVVNVFREPARIKRLLAAIAVVGGAVALLALAQDITNSDRIYWLIPAGTRAFSGPFINHSHYGQFMNLSMGAALGLLLVKLHETFSGHKVSPRHVAEFFGSPQARTIKLLTAVTVIGAATVFVSLTRGGMISMLISGGFTTLVLSSRRSLKGRAWIIVLMALGAFICVLYVGFEEVYNRLATLKSLDTAEGGRWQMVQNALAAWTQFPVFGTGLGTYSVVYPMFDQSNVGALATHAENEYIQAVAESGFTGVLALILFGVIIWAKYSRSVISSAPIRSAAYGLGFGLLAILIHSLSDFGQHLPANAVLSIVCCGLLVCLAGIRSVTAAAPQFVPVRSGISLPRSALLLPVIGIWIWALVGADNARQAQAAWNRATATERYLQGNDWAGDDDTYTDLITSAAAASAAEPDNVHYRHWLNVYRWRSLERHTDPNTGLLPDEVLPMVQKLAGEFIQAQALCPTFGPAYCLAGELQVFVLDDPNGAENIRKGYRLAPTDSTTCFAAARVDVIEGKPEEAFEKLKRACELDDGYFKPAATICIEGLARADLAQQLAGDNGTRLAYVADLLAGFDDQSELAEQIRTAAFELREKQCQQPDAPAAAHAWLAKTYYQKGDITRAIDQYRRALVKEYQQVSWRMELAKLLDQAGRHDDAVHELQICLRFKPDYEPAKRLIAMFASHPVEPQPPNAD